MRRKPNRNGPPKKAGDYEKIGTQKIIRKKKKVNLKLVTPVVPEEDTFEEKVAQARRSDIISVNGVRNWAESILGEILRQSVVDNPYSTIPLLNYKTLLPTFVNYLKKSTTQEELPTTIETLKIGEKLFSTEETVKKVNIEIINTGMDLKKIKEAKNCSAKKEERRDLVCSLCPKYFGRKEKLDDHLRSPIHHLSPIRILCGEEDCSESRSTSSEMAGHMKIYKWSSQKAASFSYDKVRFSDSRLIPEEELHTDEDDDLDLQSNCSSDSDGDEPPPPPSNILKIAA